MKIRILISLLALIIIGSCKNKIEEKDNITKEIKEYDEDREVSMDDAELINDDQAHYKREQQFLDLDELGLYGEEFNEKFIAELMKIRDEKGADYFKNYPTKGSLMGDDLKGLADAVGLAHKPSVQGNSYDINQGPVSQ